MFLVEKRVSTKKIQVVLFSHFIVLFSHFIHTLCLTGGIVAMAPFGVADFR